ncbi:hypothetical protein JTE90_003430 [Oedothorax gibbosus]|uniref:Reverse transcriptase Ty1/copia-type domain-containing protein n=1 Tax=Oedothorax gibbosus TaxID=931172 RepID=A0AAV6TXG0_9ARAC|nr:hypothetical protein JTE90_003430 [Oedothorax gibbosus]
MRKPPTRYPEAEAYTAMLSSEESLSFRDLCSLPAPEQAPWHAAMENEIDSMKENDVWCLQSAPEKVKPVSCRWILRKKRHAIMELTTVLVTPNGTKWHKRKRRQIRFAQSLVGN